MSERTWGGAAVLGVDEGEAGDAPTPVISSCLGRPWWLQGGDGAGRSCPPGWRRRRKREGEGETLGRGCWLKKEGRRRRDLGVRETHGASASALSLEQRRRRNGAGGREQSRARRAAVT